VDSLGIEEDEVIHQLPVKLLRIKKEVGMKVHKLPLDGFVEALEVSVHLGSLGIGMVVDEVQF